MKILPFSALVLAVLLAARAATANPSHPCAEIAEPEARLSCYDLAFPPTTEPVAIEDSDEKALREFGLNREQLRERKPESERDAEPARIEAVVTAVNERGDGRRVVILDNGQVWLLTEVTSKGPLRNSDKIVIRKAALGTFMLITPGRVPLRARRLD